MKTKTLILGLILGGSNITTSQVVVSTFAGSGTSGYLDANGIQANFKDVFRLAIDKKGGNIYVTDPTNNCIRKIAPDGTVTTLAGGTYGYADGTGTAAKFRAPFGIAVDTSGNVYVSEAHNNKIRKITPGGVVTTLAGSTAGYADGMGSAAKFYSPNGLTVDISGNVYVADTWNSKIRKITPAGLVSTIAGSEEGFLDSIGTFAMFQYPSDVVIDKANNIYVSDNGNERIRKITPSGEVTTFAGSGISGSADGTGVNATFSKPSGLGIDDNDNIYVADIFNHKIRKITNQGEVSTVAGTTQGFLDGSVAVAQFYWPSDVDPDASGSLYITDNGNYRIRRVAGILPVETFDNTLLYNIHPNPVGNWLNIDTPKDLIVKSFRVIDISGKCLIHKDHNKDGNIDLSTLLPGMYVIQLVTENEVKSMRIIKE